MVRPIIELTTPVEDDRPIYLVGNFNNWEISEKEYQLEKKGDNLYCFHFNEDQELTWPLEYKFVKENWEGVEADIHGGGVQNRVLKNKIPIIKNHVPRWFIGGKAFKEEFLPHRIKIAEDFVLPQLNRTRRLWALLPHDYYTSQKRYPVVYLQDGQNLFNPNGTFGNWAIDERLAVLAETNQHEYIIIAVDHAGKERISEYSPYNTHIISKSNGRKYVQFISQTLKPFIDDQFRTMPGRNHTCIGGSSLGGLISIYAGLIYPAIFGRLMIFSPSLWLSPKIYFDAIDFGKLQDTKVYLYGGNKESKTMVDNLGRLNKAFQTADEHVKFEVKMSIDKFGEHSESYWGREFPKAIKWLFE